MTARRIAVPFTRLWRGLGSATHRWSMRQELRDLRGLDDRMLQDLGISRAQAEFQARHHAWF